MYRKQYRKETMNQWTKSIQEMKQSGREKSNIAIAVLKNGQIDSSPKIISHFGGTNNIIVNYTWKFSTSS